MFKMNKAIISRIIFTLIFWSILLYFATKLDFDTLISAFDRIRWNIFVFSTIMFIIAIYFDGYAWRFMLSHIWHAKLPISTTTNIHYAAVGTGQLIPSGGALELTTRVWLMKRQLGVPSEEVLGSMLLFRLFFYCTTFISTFLFIYSIYVMHIVNFSIAVVLLIIFYFIEMIGLLFLTLAFYRLDIINNFLMFVHKILPFKIVEKFDNYLISKITGITEKFNDVRNEFKDKKQIFIFLGFVLIQYTIRQIAIWSMFYILIPNITLPPIIVVTTLTTFITSLPLFIPGNQGIRELSNVVILSSYVAQPTEVLVLIGVMQGFQIWCVGTLTVVVILYYYLFKDKIRETSKERIAEKIVDYSERVMPKSTESYTNP